jgi:hemolysin activation/secretion protein
MKNKKLPSIDKSSSIIAVDNSWDSFCQKSCLLGISISLFAFLAAGQRAFAQQPPTAGNQLQQIQTLPKQPKTSPDIGVKQDDVPIRSTAEGQKILVRIVRFSGATLFSRNELLSSIDFRPDSKHTLSELRAMAAKVTAFYRSNGYFVAQTFLPPQEIVDGAVKFSVIEGQYGEITVRNSSRVFDSTANRLMEGLNTGDSVAAAALEHHLLLLSDLPGVNVKSTMQPGASVGAADLIVDISPGQRVTGSIDADNQGNRYTGAERLGASLTVNEPTGLGDVASVRVISGEGLTYGRAAYQAQLGKTKAGFAYTSMSYALGKEFASAKVNGTAQITSLFGSYPLIRTRKKNLYVQLAYDSKKFSDRQELTTPANVTDKYAQSVMSSLNGDYQDTLGGGGVNNYSLSWTHGAIDLQGANALGVDAAGPQSNGSFNKLSYNFSRLQTITPSIALFANLRGQVASKNLDASEKFTLGGAAAVRAYPAGETNGDDGYVLSLEVRKLLSLWDQPLQLFGFFDIGSASINKNPWAAVTTPNIRTLSGGGLGLNFYGTNDLIVKAFYAFKLSKEPAISAPDASGRYWLQAVKYF